MIIFITKDKTVINKINYNTHYTFSPQFCLFKYIMVYLEGLWITLHTAHTD